MSLPYNLFRYWYSTPTINVVAAVRYNCTVQLHGTATQCSCNGGGYSWDINKGAILDPTPLYELISREALLPCNCGAAVKQLWCSCAAAMVHLWDNCGAAVGRMIYCLFLNELHLDLLICRIIFKSWNNNLQFIPLLWGVSWIPCAKLNLELSNGNEILFNL